MNFRVSSSRGSAFSLVEVVLSIGIASFCLLSLVGLFTVAMGQDRDSVRSVQAAHLMERIVLARTTAPTNAQSPSNPLPPASIPVDSLDGGAAYLSQEGWLTSADAADFQLNYRVVLPSEADKDTAARKMSHVWVAISWPAKASRKTAQGIHERSFFVALP